MLLNWLRSFIHPVKQRDVVVAGNVTYESVEPCSDYRLKPIVYAPWTEAEFHFVGFSRGRLADGTEGVGYRFYDPVSKKEFMLSEELTKILLYRK